MAQITRGVRSILSHPAVYDLLQSAVGANRSFRKLVDAHVQPQAGERILDIGCGTGNLLGYLPEDVDYLGVDLSEAYVEAAQRRYGSRGKFESGDAAKLASRAHTMDKVTAIALLHHLDDAQADQVFRTARDSLRPGGKFISLDCAFIEDQSRVARSIILMDRGQNVRSPDGYCQLARAYFKDIKCFVYNDLLRIPYTLCIIEYVP